MISRYSKEYSEFRKSVLSREGNKCSLCGSPNQLHVHHLYPIQNAPSYAIDPSNGQTLCAKCHGMVHSTNFIREPKER